MPTKTAKQSGSPDDDFDDDLAVIDAPEFQRETVTAAPASSAEDAQTELQRVLESLALEEFEPQLAFDHMAKPVFAIHVETESSEPQRLHFRNAPNLLESLEAQEIQVPYQCRDGYCGSCRCKKISGDVVYLKEPMAWINDDEILPCVSIPTSDLTLKLSG